MGDMVIVIQQLFESTDNFALTQAVVRFDINMCGQSRDVRTDGLDMKVVNVFDTFCGPHLVDQFVDVNVFWDTLEQDVSGFAKDAYRSPADEQNDDHGDQGIKDKPFSIEHNDAADDDANRGDGISQNMQEGAADIEIIVGVAMQAAGSNQVHYQADDGDDEHLLALDCLRLKHAV